MKWFYVIIVSSDPEGVIVEGLLDLREQWDLPVSQSFVPALQRKNAALLSSKTPAMKAPSTITLKIKNRKATPFPRHQDGYEECEEEYTSSSSCSIAFDGKTIKTEIVKTDEAEILPVADTEVVTVVDGESSRRSQPPAKKQKSSCSSKQ